MLTAEIDDEVIGMKLVCCKVKTVLEKQRPLDCREGGCATYWMRLKRAQVFIHSHDVNSVKRICGLWRTRDAFVLLTKETTLFLSAVMEERNNGFKLTLCTQSEENTVLSS